MPLERLIPRKNLEALVKQLRRQRKKIVFTNGVFDILHRGHVEYLADCRKLGDLLIVGLNSDASVRRLKGDPRPLQKQNDRAVILLALRSVDYVVIFSEDTPEKLIKQISPDILAKGSDYQVHQIVGADHVRSTGGRVRRIPLRRGRSTSVIAKRLKNS